MSNTFNIENLNIENLYLCLGGTQVFDKNPTSNKSLFDVARLPFDPQFPSTADAKHWVKPSGDGTTGSICAKVSYQSAKYEVWAKITSTPSMPQMSGATKGKAASADNKNWEWTYSNSNMIPGALHSAYGIQNHLHIWYKTNQSDTEYIYDNFISFRGVTGNPSAPCGGSGSPSGSGSNVPLHGELQSGVILNADIADGDSQGRHVLMPSGNLKWKAFIGNNLCEFSISTCGKKMVLETNNLTEYSHEFSPLPFHASIDGTIINSKYPIFLFLK